MSMSGPRLVLKLTARASAVARPFSTSTGSPLAPQANKPFQASFARPRSASSYMPREASKGPRVMRAAETTRGHVLPTDTLQFPGISELYQTGFATKPFSKEVAALLSRPVKPEELEIDKDRGYVYLKEQMYRDMLNEAFGADGWKLMPTTPFVTTKGDRTVYRGYMLQIDGRFVSETIGDWSVASAGGRSEAELKCDHAALVRVGKDLGIASELWDPSRADALRDAKWAPVWMSGDKGKKRVWTPKEMSK
ncbi:hypothetical protein PhCBS80983_g05412 [Powellomyces hirtus]|uniref:Mitochondrial genome maintenance protein MGM101 n=1 Tax=Powellomyces hirtus TaxID=109895 RepID=A0A507DWS0_9FUNG|nr:hypothetical protein PhCBS80983_g05412 [Powellomyces hirtus]